MYYKFSCPVPKEQRPINEYMELVQSNFYNVPIQPDSIFLKKLSKTLLFCFFLCLPLSSLFLNINQSIFKFFLLNSLISCFILILIIFRLLLAWNYIKERLYNPTIFYEESGWYDGRLWVKSKNILVQDRLVHSYQVVPGIKKLNTVLLFFLSFFSALLLLLFFQ